MSADSTHYGPILASEINSLPPRLRDYVHHLETYTDPAGYSVENAALRENIRYCCLIIKRQRDALAQLGVEYP